MKPTKILVHRDPERARKALRSVAETGFLSVWEGAVRSSKTVLALMAFVIYMRRSPEDRFLMSGRTVKTIEQNCIFGDYGLLNLIPGSSYRKVGETRAVVFRVAYPTGTVTKTVVIHGASNIRDYMAIRGNSYGGWFADEINMHDREFVTEALKRTAASKDRRHLWSLNPDSPKAWIYRDYLDRYDAMSPEELKVLGGYRWWHFTPADNPAMTESMIAALRLQYPEGSVMYDRYILGLRSAAEGLVYPFFGDSCVREPPDRVRARYASIDFGAVHPTAMGWYGRDPEDGTWYKLREWIATPDDSMRMTVAEYMDVFERICGEMGGIPRMNVTIDYGGGGEALAREAEKRRWMPVNPDKAVLEGIGVTARMLNTRRLLISPECPGTIESLRMYRWDQKAAERGETKPIKMDDDAADETRYFVATFMEPRVRT